MSDRTTINVSKEAHRKAKSAKRDDESWSDYILRCIGSDADTSLSAGADMDTEAVADAIRAELDTDAPNFDEIQRTVRAIEERTGRIERTLEQLEGGMR
jgi:predicted CopG family antitoxin